MAHNAKGYVARWWIQRCRGNATQFAVLHALATFADNKTGKAWPLIETLAEITGIHRSHVTKALAELAAAGVISKQRQWKRSTVYKLNYDEPEVAESATSEVAESATSEVAESATSEVAESATHNGLKNGSVNSPENRPSPQRIAEMKATTAEAMARFIEQGRAAFGVKTSTK